MEEEVEREHLLEILYDNATLFQLVVGALQELLRNLAHQFFTTCICQVDHFLSHIADVYCIKAHALFTIHVLLECRLVHFQLIADTVAAFFLLGLALLQNEIVVSRMVQVVNQSWHLAHMKCSIFSHKITYRFSLGGATE